MSVTHYAGSVSALSDGSADRRSVAAERSPRDDWAKAKRREARTGYLFIFPALFGFVVFFLTPAIRAIWISFTDWNLLKKPNFIGFSNYRELWHDPLFWNAIRVTIKYAIFNIPIQTVIGLFLAAFMARKARGFVIRGVLLFPYLLSNVIAALVWAWIFDPTLGFANQFLRWLHLPQFGFLGESGAALPSIAFINIWRHMGFTALLCSPGCKPFRPRSMRRPGSMAPRSGRCSGVSPYRSYGRFWPLSSSPVSSDRFRSSTPFS